MTVLKLEVMSNIDKELADQVPEQALDQLAACLIPTLVEFLGRLPLAVALDLDGMWFVRSEIFPCAWHSGVS